MKKYKIENILFSFIIIFTILSISIAAFSQIPAASAYSLQTWGSPSIQTSLARSISVNNCVFTQFNASLFMSTKIYVVSMSVYGTGGTGHYIKGIILNPDRTILAVSNPCLTTGTRQWYNFTFPEWSLSEYIVMNNTLGDYWLGIIGADDFSCYYGTSGTDLNNTRDLTNLYSSPSDPTDMEVVPTYPNSELGIYITYLEYTDPDPEATPTPTPTATAVPSATTNPQFTAIWDTLASLINLLVPLLCVVLPAFFGYKFAGAWGFMAGVNIGAILAYTILGADIFPLWGIVALLIIDALLLFGKVGLHE